MKSIAGCDEHFPHSRRTAGRAGFSVLLPAKTLILTIAASCQLHAQNKPEAGSSVPPAATAAEPQTVEKLSEERRRLDATLYANEVAAQRHEQAFVRLWDTMRVGQPMEALKRFPFNRLLLGVPRPAPVTDWGVEGIVPVEFIPPLKALSHAEYESLLESFKAQGVEIVQSEWHHSRFDPATATEPARSTVSFEIHALFGVNTQRIIVRGQLKVKWQKPARPDSDPVAEEIEPSGLRMIARKGTPMFVEKMMLDPKIEAPRRYPRTSPILIFDLDGDGLSEIILAGCNLVYGNKGRFQFEKRDFLGYAIREPMEAGILADFNNDGFADYVGGYAPDQSILLFEGTASGTFPNPPNVCFDGKLPGLHVLTSGDVDGDGDLDLFAGQWKAPYAEGAMPTPYYDAKDGFPNHLLLNDGKGNFTDGTVKAGLGPKRNRRTFSASLLDLDGDRHPDLVVVADFSGLDLYRNRGDGTFEDVTDSRVDERHGFGMSHSFGDYDGDGKLDLYMVGMSSTTARRLDALGLAREGFDEYTKMRAAMSYGNRLYVSRGHRFEQPPFAASAARTGWSWGCTTADFDLDGDADLYVSNGHLSGASAKDYCTKFWCHDLYTGSSRPSPALNEFYKRELGTKLGREFSWNGFEHKVLFLNHPGTGFENMAFLLGVAQEFDGRAVVSDDLDADGRLDLAVVEYRTDTMSQRLHVLRNEYESSRHWIGVRLKSGPGFSQPDGAVVTARSGSRAWVKPVVTGDSFTAQHARTVHFGLGATTAVDSIEVAWANGKVSRLAHPAPDRYHDASEKTP
jgi:enediyne biosynthesis protein E4